MVVVSASEHRHEPNVILGGEQPGVGMDNTEVDWFAVFMDAGFFDHLAHRFHIFSVSGKAAGELERLLVDAETVLADKAVIRDAAVDMTWDAHAAELPGVDANVAALSAVGKPDWRLLYIQKMASGMRWRMGRRGR